MKLKNIFKKKIISMKNALRLDRENDSLLN
jgi:hypothetical protein